MGHSLADGASYNVLCFIWKSKISFFYPTHTGSGMLHPGSAASAGTCKQVGQGDRRNRHSSSYPASLWTDALLPNACHIRWP